MRGQRRALKTMMPFSKEVESLGSPAKFHSRAFCGSCDTTGLTLKPSVKDAAAARLHQQLSTCLQRYQPVHSACCCSCSLTSQICSLHQCSRTVLCPVAAEPVVCCSLGRQHLTMHHPLNSNKVFDRIVVCQLNLGKEQTHRHKQSKTSRQASPEVCQ